MEKPEILKLKVTSQRNCEFILNLYQTFSKKEIKQSERYYVQKLDYLKTNNSYKQLI